MGAPTTPDLGLITPWKWVQPTNSELVSRLIEARELNVHERERENLCSVAAGRIVALERTNAELVAALQALLSASERHIFGDECMAERDAARDALARVGAA